MVIIKAKVTKIGNSYAFFIPKALVDCKVIPTTKKVTLEFDPEKQNAVLRILTGKLSKYYKGFESS